MAAHHNDFSVMRKNRLTNSHTKKIRAAVRSPLSHHCWCRASKLSDWSFISPKCLLVALTYGLPVHTPEHEPTSCMQATTSAHLTTTWPDPNDRKHTCHWQWDQELVKIISIIRYNYQETIGAFVVGQAIPWSSLRSHAGNPHRTKKG